jgi:hypothetical protein
LQPMICRFLNQLYAVSFEYFYLHCGTSCSSGTASLARSGLAAFA